MTSSPPIVAICIPSGDMVHADFAANLAALCLDPGAHAGVISCKGSIIAVVRNQCVAAAQLIKATHLFFLDSDMVFPLDVLKRLLAHKKNVVGAIYSRRREPFLATGEVFSASTTPSTNGLRQMAMLPTGCLLIEMSVFDRLSKPYFSGRVEGEHVIGEDFHFCERLKAAAIEMWEDPSLSKEVGHIGEKIFRL